MTRRCRLYLITPPVLEPAAFAPLLAQALAGGDVACVQLRLKPPEDAVILGAGRVLGPLIQGAGAAFLVNDRPDLADALDADGVHVGQDDASYAQARKLMGPDRIVGVTCHASRHLAMVAAEAGADYVAFGAFYPTGTKDTRVRADPEILTIWQETMETPCVAIGGVTTLTAGAMARAGADFIAVAAGVWDYPEGPKAAVAAFNRALDEAAAA